MLLVIIMINVGYTMELRVCRTLTDLSPQTHPIVSTLQSDGFSV